MLLSRVDLDQLQKIAIALATSLQKGDILTLTGGLGSGKTALARMIIQHLKPGVKVPSPTFNLVKTYDCGDLEIWHCDCYRLSSIEAALETGITEAFHCGVAIIEWPQLIAPLIPQSSRCDITFQQTPEGSDQRELRFKCGANWQQRLQMLIKGF